MEPDDRPRLAISDDVEEATRVVQDAFAGYVSQMDRPPAPMLVDLGPRIADGDVWVVGRPVAGVACLRHRKDELELEILAVDPGAQGSGLGSRLIDRATGEARRAGYDRLALSTNEVMRESAALYRRLGFVQVDRRTEDGYRRIFFVRRLTLDDVPPGRGDRASGDR